MLVGIVERESWGINKSKWVRKCAASSNTTCPGRNSVTLPLPSHINIQLRQQIRNSCFAEPMPPCWLENQIPLPCILSQSNTKYEESIARWTSSEMLSQILSHALGPHHDSAGRLTTLIHVGLNVIVSAFSFKTTISWSWLQHISRHHPLYLPRI